MSSLKRSIIRDQVKKYIGNNNINREWERLQIKRYRGLRNLKAKQTTK